MGACIVIQNKDILNEEDLNLKKKTERGSKGGNIFRQESPPAGRAPVARSPGEGGVTSSPGRGVLGGRREGGYPSPPSQDYLAKRQSWCERCIA